MINKFTPWALHRHNVGSPWLDDFATRLSQCQTHHAGCVCEQVRKALVEVWQKAEEQRQQLSASRLKEEQDKALQQRAQADESFKKLQQRNNISQEDVNEEAKKLEEGVARSRFLLLAGQFLYREAVDRIFAQFTSPGTDRDAAVATEAQRLQQYGGKFLKLVEARELMERNSGKSQDSRDHEMTVEKLLRTPAFCDLRKSSELAGKFCVQWSKSGLTTSKQGDPLFAKQKPISLVQFRDFINNIWPEGFAAMRPTRDGFIAAATRAFHENLGK